ncbi:MAG: prepilin-type N-terminal cleavage/methylation domain-containing protein [Candidatus Saccharimonas sp.]
MYKIRQGFTIIELVLVMAITGLVVAVILAGIGVSLRAERYRDATNQTINFFQGVYSSTANIANDRPTGNTCSAAGISIDDGGEGRGTSDCLLLGYVLRSVNGREIVSRQVIARVDVSKTEGADEDTESQNFVDSNLVAVGDQSNRYTLDWGSSLINNSGDPVSFTLLVIRAPLSGVIRTYYNLSSGTASLNSLIASPPAADARFCIDPSGVFDIGIRPNGFIIDRKATNSTGVRQLAAGTC